MFIIVSIGLLIVIGIIITAVMVIDKKSETKGKQTSNIELYLKSSTNDINYIIFQNNATQKGLLNSDSFTPITVNSNDLKLYCYNKNHYTSETDKKFSNAEINLTKSKLECSPRTIGKLDIDLIRSQINNPEGKIIFNVTAKNGDYQKIGTCIKWTAGFINIKPLENYLYCEGGVWKSFKYYDAVSNTYDYLPKNHFICGNKIEKCSRVEGNKCTPIEVKTPNRFIGKVDECYYFGDYLRNGQTKTLVFTFKSLENKNQLDNIDFIFYDHDLRFNELTNKFEYKNQDSEDLGAEDITFRIKYGGDSGLIE